MEKPAQAAEDHATGKKSRCRRRRGLEDINKADFRLEAEEPGSQSSLAAAFGVCARVSVCVWFPPPT